MIPCIILMGREHNTTLEYCYFDMDADLVTEFTFTADQYPENE